MMARVSEGFKGLSTDKLGKDNVNARKIPAQGSSELVGIAADNIEYIDT